MLVLAKGVGATHHSGATIDVLGYAPDRVEHPGEAVGALVSERPGHPYAAVGAAGVAAALEWFQGQFAAGPLAPYAYSGGLEENLLLPTAVGGRKPTAAAPVTMTRGDLRDDAELCIVGLRGLKDFHAPLAADNLARAGHRTRSVELDVTPPSGSRADANPLAFARAFDDPGFRAEVAAQLVNRPTAAERLGFPAVLGIADPHAAWADLEHRCGRPVFEVPTLPPSVPGMRVFATLRDAVRRAGGKVILNAVVTGARATGGRVESLRAHIGLRETDFGAGWVVLATGGFAQAGSSSARAGPRARPRSGCRSPACRGPASRASARTTSPSSRWRAPAWRRTPSCGRSTPAGERCYENVLVAGATLAGAEPWREKSGDGISLTTGHRAAELIGRERGERRRRGGERWRSADHDVLGYLMRGSLDHCVKCTICESFCPVSNVTPLFPGPKYVGPQAERFRVHDEVSADASLDYCSGCGDLHPGVPAGRAHRRDQHPGAREDARAHRLQAARPRPGAPGPRRPARHARRAARQPDASRTARCAASPSASSGCTAARRCRRSRAARSRAGPASTTRRRRQPQVAYFHGCGANWYEPDTGEKTVALLERLAAR